MSMNARIALLSLPALLLAAAGAFAADGAPSGKVTILSVTPKEPYAKDKIALKYEAVAGPEGDHLHLNVDGKRVEVIHELNGTAMVGPLKSGNHHICLAINTKAHVPTGVESCVDVMVW